MEGAFSLRRLDAGDGAAYATLLASSPDTGSVGVASRFQIDPYQALVGVHGDTAGVVAEAPGFDGFVGGGLVRFGQCQWGDMVLPWALLNTLVVHPDFRRRGVASALAKWRRDYTRERFGDHGVTWAVIQRNNTGSELTARKWASQFFPNCMTIIPKKMRLAPPKPSPQFIVRPVQTVEVAAIAEQLNLFYRNYDLYPPETGETLTAWLRESPFDTPFRHYYVVGDPEGNLLAGLAMAENYRVRTSAVTRMPDALRFLNLFLHVVPPDGVLRELGINRVWHAPGHAVAARHLLETVRWEWRQKATTLMLSADPRSPLLEVYGVRPWTMKTVGSIALRGPTPHADDRLFYYGG